MTNIRIPAQAIREQHTFHLQQERKWKPRIKRAMNSNIKAFIAYSKANGVKAAVSVIDTIIQVKPIADCLKALYIDVGVRRGRQVKRELEQMAKKSDSDFLTFMLDAMNNFFILYGMAYAVSILATQRKRILKTVAEVLQPNITTDQLTAALEANPNLVEDILRQNQLTAAQENMLTDQLQVIASDRGLPVIARTEVTRALNFAAYKAASRMDFFVDKTWVSLHDHRTRRRNSHSPYDHWEPLGQTVPLDEHYIISGELLMYPADPAGSKANVIGCRCGQIFAPVRDKANRIIYKPRNITVIRPTSPNNRTVITI